MKESPDTQKRQRGGGGRDFALQSRSVLTYHCNLSAKYEMRWVDIFSFLDKEDKEGVGSRIFTKAFRFQYDNTWSFPIS